MFRGRTMKLSTWISSEWRHAWKWFGVQVPVLAGSLGMLYGQIDFLQDLIGPQWYGAVNGCLCLAMIYNAVRRK